MLCVKHKCDGLSPRVVGWPEVLFQECLETAQVPETIEENGGLQVLRGE